MPLTLTITNDTAQGLIHDITTLATAPMALNNLARLQIQQRSQQQPIVDTAKSIVVEQPAQSTNEQIPTAEPVADKDVPKRGRGKNKPQPTLEGVAAAQSETAADAKAVEQPEADPLEIPDFLKNQPKAEGEPVNKPAHDVPTTQEEARKLCGKVIDECGAETMEKIIRKEMKLNKFNEIPVERYGELAGLCHEALSK